MGGLAGAIAFSVELKLAALVEGDRDRRREAAGEEADAVAIAEEEAAAGVRQDDDAGEEAEAGVEDLGVAAPLRRVVVEEDHPISEGHRPRRPGEDRLVGDQRPEVEEAEAVEERGHVAAGDRHRPAAGEDLGELGPLGGDHRALARPRLDLVGPLEVLDPIEVLAVDEADRLDRRADLGLDQIGGPAGVLQVLHGRDRVGEAAAVEVLQVPEAVLLGPVDRRQLGVSGEDRVAADVEPEVDRPVAERRLKLLILRLPLLPAGAETKVESST